MDGPLDAPRIGEITLRDDMAIPKTKKKHFYKAGFSVEAQILDHLTFRVGGTWDLAQLKNFPAEVIGPALSQPCDYVPDRADAWDCSNESRFARRFPSGGAAQKPLLLQS